MMAAMFPHTRDMLLSLGISPSHVPVHGCDETGYLVLGRHPDGRVLPSTPDEPEMSRVPWPTQDAWLRFQEARERDVIARTPHRVQLSRRKGWRKPENTVSVARPSKWGNPYVVGRTLLLLTGDSEANFIGSFDRVQRVESITPRLAVDMYRLWLSNWNMADLDVPRPGPGEWRELRGKNLGCWCPLDQPCHADVLLELANGAPA